jgi:hypothetical protein
MKQAAAKMKNAKRSSKVPKADASPSRDVDARIKALGDWRGETLGRVRKLIKEAAPAWSKR